MREHFQKLFEANPLSVHLIRDIAQSMKNIFMRLVIAQSLSSGDDLPHIGLPTIVRIKVEQGPEIFDLLAIKCRVFCNYRLGEDTLVLFFDYSFLVDFTHLDIS
jgi:hypothetical protein